MIVVCAKCLPSVRSNDDQEAPMGNLSTTLEVLDMMHLLTIVVQKMVDHIVME